MYWRSIAGQEMGQGLHCNIPWLSFHCFSTSLLLRVPLTTPTTHAAQSTSQHKHEQWDFNGTVPGPFIRARAGDVVELSLTNRETIGLPAQY